MITQERSAGKTAERPVGPVSPVQTGGGSESPPPPQGRGEGWWQSWPLPPNGPQPINRGSLWRGAAVVTPALVLVDGALGVMAWQASGNWLLGLAVGGVLFAFTALEFGIVAWAAKMRQDQERRQSGGR